MGSHARFVWGLLLLSASASAEIPCSARLDADLAQAHGKGFARPVHVNFMCEQGIFCSPLFKDAFKEHLLAQGITRGVILSTQGAAGSANEDRVPVLSLTDCVRRIWDKDYVLLLVHHQEKLFKKAAQLLATPAGRRTIYNLLRSEGDQELADRIAFGSPHSPELILLSELPILDKGARSTALHRYLIKFVLLEEFVRGNALIP